MRIRPDAQRITWRLLLPVAWMGLIFLVSGIPSEQIPDAGTWDLLVKKGGHMASYALLAVLWLRALELRFPTGPAAQLALVITVLYAISDEYHQTFVPGRNGTAVDVLVDAAGALLGTWGYAWRGRH